jgi:hypothetical protein
MTEGRTFCFVDGSKEDALSFSESHSQRSVRWQTSTRVSFLSRPLDCSTPDMISSPQSAFLRVHVAPRPSPLTSAHARPGRSASASPVHAPGAPRREREAAFVARAPTGRAELDRERVAGLLASREPRIEERPRGVSVGERRARHARARARWSLRDAMRARRGARALRGPPARVDAPRARPAPTRPASRGQVLRRRVRRRIRRVVVVFSRRVRLGRGRDEPGQLPARGGAPA